MIRAAIITAKAAAVALALTATSLQYVGLVDWFN